MKIHEKQKTYKVSVPNMGTMDKPRFKKCNKCGAFLQSTSKKLNYWDKYCFGCGGAF